MSDIGRVGGHVPPAKQDQPTERTGLHGQPVGMPAPNVPGQAKIAPGVVGARDASRAAAAEQLRATGGASAVEELLGLNRHPPAAGALAPPPDNREALRHMPPAMRRAISRSLLQRQHERVQHLVRLLYGDGGGRGGGGGDESRESGGGGDGSPPEAEPAQLSRARAELGCAVQMLQLLEELLEMQDYTFAQMGAQNQR